MTLEQAREVVPFHIEVVGYLPEGYALEEYVALMEGPAYGNEVEGLFMAYSRIDRPPFLTRICYWLNRTSARRKAGRSI